MVNPRRVGGIGKDREIVFARRTFAIIQRSEEILFRPAAYALFMIRCNVGGVEGPEGCFYRATTRQWLFTAVAACTTGCIKDVSTMFDKIFGCRCRSGITATNEQD